jgi:Peptidase M50B-like
VSITQATLSGGTAAAIGLVALAVVTIDASWQVIRHLTVMAHEGAHAVTGLLFGSVNGIELRANGTGATDISTATGLRAFPVVLAGYLGPSAFGLGAAKLIELSYTTVVLYGLLFLLFILLIGLRWSFGLITVLLAGGIVFGIARYTPMVVQVTTAYLITWLLLLSGVRRVLEVGVRSDDGGELRAMTYLPGALWFVLWLAATLAAAVEGFRLLVLRA